MKRIQKEKDIIRLMIKLYCCKNHKSKNKLCYSCESLLEYAHKRLINCKYGGNKSSCNKCSTPCYKKDMRIAIKEVMKFSGPRLLIYSPYEFIRHIAK